MSLYVLPAGIETWRAFETFFGVGEGCSVLLPLADAGHWGIPCDWAV